MIAGRLRSDDIYGLSRVYSAAEHRGAALASQASLLYVALYFMPETLHKNKAAMREVVDKHFSDSWCLPLYMGERVDLSVEWERYASAREALGIESLTAPHVKDLVKLHRSAIIDSLRAMDAILVEGVLSETYVVDNIATILELIKTANMSLRWMLLHRRSETKRWRDLVLAPGGFSEERPILDFLLRTALLEYKIKAHVKHLLSVKSAKWVEDRGFTSQALTELSDYFSGARALTRVAADEGLKAWFAGLAKEVGALDFNDGVLAGRKMRQLVRALDEVTAFDTIDATPQVKEYIGLARERLLEMVRTCAISETTLSDLNTLTDFSYAWELIQDFLPEMHARIQGDAAAVRPLRAAVLKLTSMLDVPLVRIVQAGSRDAESVAQYYSGELVGFLRAVMGVIPVIVFGILREAITLQSTRMKALPVKIEAQFIKDYAQGEQRVQLAKRTHEISIFTEGVLAMEATLLGVIKVDPRQILIDGIRAHLVDQLSLQLHNGLAFDMRVARGKDVKGAISDPIERVRTALIAFRKSFEYVQDYIRIYGMRMWQEEMTRVIGFATEQEANRFVKVKILPEASKYQTVATPLRVIARAPAGDSSPAHCVTFMGRTLEALLAITHPARAQYGPGPTGGGWYDPTGRELIGVGFFVDFNASLSVPGLVGLDRLLGFTVERDLKTLLRAYAGELKQGAGQLLSKLGEELQPTSAVSANIVKTLNSLATQLKKPLASTADRLVAIGQAQLLRHAIAHELRFSARLDSNFLSGAIEVVNDAVLADVRRHYVAPDKHVRAALGQTRAPRFAHPSSKVPFPFLLAGTPEGRKPPARVRRRVLRGRWN